MFPTETKKEETENLIISTQLCYTPNYNFKTKNTVLKNGTPELIKEYRNIKNWLVKFLLTPIEKVKIYEGTGFGTSLYLLKGKKAISYKEYLQIVNEIKDGVKLHPAIDEAKTIEFSKENDVLYIEITLKLKDGSLIKEETEVYNFNEQ